MNGKKAQPAGGGEIFIFQVRLRCEAAPGIGCGLRAKPVLQDLERVQGIRESRLNRAGNLIAVVRTMAKRGTAGADAVLEVFRDHRMAVM